MNNTHSNSRIKIAFFALFTTAVVFTACKKEAGLGKEPIVPRSSQRVYSDSESYAITTALENAYDSIHYSYNGNEISTLIPIDSGVYLIEGIYNMKLGRQSFLENEEFHTVVVPWTTNSSEDIAISEVAHAFYHLKDSLTDYLGNVSYPNKHFTTFDVSSTADGQGSPTITVFLGSPTNKYSRIQVMKE